MEDITRHDNGNISLKITLPWDRISDEYEKAVIKAVAEFEIAGFRKGKAPRNLVEPKLDSSKLYSEAVQSLLPEAYSQTVKKHNLKPILYPQISVEKAKPKSDWEFTATTCEAPSVGLENYKDLAKSVTPEPKETRASRIIAELQKNAKVKIPDLLVEEEANHRLSRLADNLTGMGLTTESYLHSRKTSLPNLKAQTARQAASDLEVEFILEHIRSRENLADRDKTLDFLLQVV